MGQRDDGLEPSFFITLDGIDLGVDTVKVSREGRGHAQAGEFQVFLNLEPDEIQAVIPNILIDRGDSLVGLQDQLQGIGEVCNLLEA